MSPAPTDPSMNLESLHAIATMVAQQRNLDAVLTTVVESLLEGSDLALARIWLNRPGDICSTCRVRDKCPDQTRCLHLAASSSRPMNPESGDEWFREDGFYQRFPLGVRRIGEIGDTGESLMLTDTADDSAWFATNDWLRHENVKAFCGHPLVFRDEILGVLAVFSRSPVTDQQFAWLQAFADSAAVAIANANAFSEIESLKSQLELENEYLRDEIRGANSVGGIVGQSLGLQKALQQIELVAPTDSTVLVLGESGVGKELIARAIHDESPRADRSMIKVNCASIPRELFESEFFGHVKGSFTGATRDRVGRFELADGGTLFLDEVGEIPLDMQSKLLRVLQEGTFERVGEETTRTADAQMALSIAPQFLEPHVRLLQLLDSMSLYLSLNDQDNHELTDVPRESWDKRCSMVWRRIDVSSISLEPYPFDLDPLIVRVPVRVIESNDLHATQEMPLSILHGTPLETREISFSSAGVI